MSTRTTIEPGVRKYVADDGTITYEARIKDSRTGRTHSQRFARLAHAKKWRAQMLVDKRHGLVKAPTLNEYAATVIARMRSGETRRPSGDPYRDYTIDGYDRSLRIHILPHLGTYRLDAVTYPDVQKVATTLAKTKQGATVRNAINALSTVYRHARLDRLVDTNPTSGVSSPARGRRGDDVVVQPDQIAAYLAALDAELRTVWALMFYGGLRIGEALGLEWRDVQNGQLRIRQQMLRGGTVGPVKTKAGVRTVPIIAPLAAILADAPRARYVAGDEPASYWTAARRAATCFKQAGLEAVSPHAARHTFASVMIAAGVDAKMLSVVLGHESITTTLDIYGHLFPSSYDAFRAAADSYLGRA